MLTQTENITISNEELIKRFLNDGRLRGISRHTVRTYQSHLRPLIVFSENNGIPIMAMTRDNIKEFVAVQMAKRLSPTTVNDYLRMIRILFRWMLEEGIVERDPSCTIKKVKEPKREKPILSLEDVSKLLDACPERTFVGIRNRCMIRLLWDCGLRRSEIAGALIKDLDFENSRLGIIGKGSKFALVTLSAATVKALNLWLSKRKRIKAPFIFVDKKGNPLSADWLTHLISKIGRKAGLKVSPHLIRHSVISWLAAEGMNAFDLQQFARHDDLSTTMGYVNSARIREKLPAEIRRFSPGNKI